MSDKSIIPINIGYGNFVIAGRVLAILGYDSSPMKRKREILKDENKLLDATFGRRTRSIILLDDGTGVLSSLQPETIAARMEKSDKSQEVDHE